MENRLDQPLVSVIVPFYNSATYMDKTIPTYLSQTYDNLELIFVDDGSSDETLVKLSEYAKLDERIVVVTKPNGGLSSARNVGVDHATGEYGVFVDSDDFIADYFVEVLLEPFLLNKELFASITGFEDVNGYDESFEFSSNLSGRRTHLRADMALIELLKQADSFDVSAWGKMYAMADLKQAKFKEGILFEDLQFLVPFYLPNLSRDVVMNNIASYAYVNRATSIMHSRFSPKLLDLVDVVEEGRELLRTRKALLLAYDTKALSALTGVYKRALKNGNYHDTDAIWKSLKSIEIDARMSTILFPTLKANVLHIFIKLGRRIFDGMIRSVPKR